MPDKTDRLAAIAGAQTTVADKIRALSAAGVARADIARFLGKRYQHVRNVLEGDAQSQSGGQSSGPSGYVLGHVDLSGVQEQPTAYKAEANDDPAEIDRRSSGVVWLRVRPDGSLPLPSEFIAALEALPGHRVFAQLKDGAVTLRSSERAAEEARELARRLLPQGVSLSESLLADRRAELARELEDG